MHQVIDFVVAFSQFEIFSCNLFHFDYTVIASRPVARQPEMFLSLFS